MTLLSRPKTRKGRALDALLTVGIVGGVVAYWVHAKREVKRAEKAMPPVVGGWWPWSTEWYALAIQAPGGRARWLGPRKLGTSDAQVWKSQAVEGHWDAAVTLYRADNGSWTRVG